MSESEHAVTNRIASLHVKGFRSLADLQLDDIPNPMVLLGANGAGKSNILKFVRLLKEMARQRLGEFVLEQGGADDQVFGGRRSTAKIDAVVGLHTALGDNRFSFVLRFAHPGRFFVTDEVFRHRATAVGDDDHGVGLILESTAPESEFFHIAKSPEAKEEQRQAADLLEGSVLYQFHDTSDDSPLKTWWDAEEKHRLLENAGNLASVLLHLSHHHRERFDIICYYVSRVLPGFRRFQIDEAHGKTFLRWEAGGSRKTFGAHLTSDGTLRFFALVTLLNLPSEVLPGIVLLDEPELGLHPSAITLIAEMVKSVALERQVVVATQSPLFVDFFSPDEIVVLELEDGRTLVRRPSELDLGQWLEEYTTGEIWRKNLIGGRP